MIGRGFETAADAFATAGFFAAGSGGCGAACALAAGVGAGFGAAGAAIAGAVLGSEVMIFTGGIEAALGKSIVVGRPVGPGGVGMADVIAAMAADDAAPAPLHAAT